MALTWTALAATAFLSFSLHVNAAEHQVAAHSQHCAFHLGKFAEDSWLPFGCHFQDLVHDLTSAAESDNVTKVLLLGDSVDRFTLQALCRGHKQRLPADLHQASFPSVSGESRHVCPIKLHCKSVNASCLKLTCNSTDEAAQPDTNYELAADLATTSPLSPLQQQQHLTRKVCVFQLQLVDFRS